jgi:tetratricopeptide (TPR) repeat protein
VTRRDLWIAAGLALGTALAFAGVVRCGFVSLDDGEYVTRNAVVLQGLTLQGLSWAATTFQASNWHPLTWLSHMLDVSLFGTWAAGHHATSVALHAASAVLLFLGLARVTGARWPSAFAAGLFAVHPLRVESVAWVAERKDVLCTLLFLLALVLHGRWARGDRRARVWSIVAAALALLAKPMAVTLPFALLIADFWPLRRPLGAKLLREKWPFLALAAASCAVTLGAQLSTGASEPWFHTPLPARIAFVPVEYLRYLELSFWPSGLAVLYPHPGESLGAAEVIAALAVLAAVTALAVWQARPRPWLLAGWLWFGVTLVPVLGFVHVGFQGIADRYTYIPSIGLSVAVAFGASELAERLRLPVAARAGVTGAVLAALAFLTFRQVAYWRDGVTLYERALAVTENNFAIHAFLADDLAPAGHRAEALAHYREAIRIRPDFPHAHYGLGVTWEEEHRLDDAIAEYRAALRANPDFTAAHFNLATLLGMSGQFDESAAHYRRVLELQPGHAGARQGLAILESLQRRGR